MKRLLLLLCALTAVGTLAAAERELSIQTPMCRVYGTLLTPDVATETVVLIIAGSGPTDRNGNSPAGINASSYYLLANELCAAGYASLRYDKRAIGASASPEATNATLRFDYYIDDASAWVDTLAAMGFTRIVLAGHSEGSQIAIEVAAENPNVAAVVSLCGAGEPIDATLRRQLAAQLPFAESVRANLIIDKLLQGKHVDDNDIPRNLLTLFYSGIQDYMISWFGYNPAKTIARVAKPILIIGGTTDIQITVADAERLAAAQPAAKKTIIAEMNHVLKRCPSTDQTTQLAVYADPSLPLHDELMRAISGFLEAL